MTVDRSIISHDVGRRRRLLRGWEDTRAIAPLEDRGGSRPPEMTEILSRDRTDRSERGTGGCSSWWRVGGHVDCSMAWCAWPRCGRTAPLAVSRHACSKLCVGSPSIASIVDRVTDPDRAVNDRRRIAELDGLRALSFLCVYQHHIDGQRGWGWAIEVFFVLSSYLLVARLLEERERTGGIEVLRFYRR